MNAVEELHKISRRIEEPDAVWEFLSALAKHHDDLAQRVAQLEKKQEQAEGRSIW